ncbi:MAG: hypothetical protein ACI4TK_17530 [Agathobacter sp.]
MKQFKKVVTAILMVGIVMSLMACGNTGDKNSDSEKNSSEIGSVADTQDKNSQQTSQDDGKIQYKVTVVDESGNPIAGAMVQMCADTCFPAVADENGVATFRLAEAEYKVSFLSLPEGYAHMGEETNYYFDAGSTEMTITLKKAQ